MARWRTGARDARQRDIASAQLASCARRGAADRGRRLRLRGHDGRTGTSRSSRWASLRCTANGCGCRPAWPFRFRAARWCRPRRRGNLQAASSGRFMLGLGSQVKGHNERRFSVPCRRRRPAWPNTCRRSEPSGTRGPPASGQLRGGALPVLAHDAETSRLSRSNGPAPPIMIAAAPAMLRVAGQHCDGVRLHGFARRTTCGNTSCRSCRPGSIGPGAAAATSG